MFNDNPIVICGYTSENAYGKEVHRWFVYNIDNFYQAAKKLADSGMIGEDVKVLRCSTFPAFYARRFEKSDPWRLYHNDEYVTILDNIIY